MNEFSEAPTPAQVQQLLAEAGLPTEDLDDAPGLRLFGLRRDDGQWMAVVGLQLLDAVALLRSLAVAPAECGRGIGARLVATAEAQARRSGRQVLYLLTTGAAAYFERLGYEAVAREEAPEAIRRTRQFTQLCPASAQLMRKRLGVARD